MTRFYHPQYHSIYHSIYVWHLPMALGAIGAIGRCHTYAPTYVWHLPMAPATPTYVQEWGDTQWH